MRRESPQRRRELGAWLRRERERRLWSRAEMGRQLAAAARALGHRGVPAAEDLAHCVYRWERGIAAPSERYRLYYCKALGIPRGAFGAGRPPAVYSGAPLGFLAAAMGRQRERLGSCQAAREGTP